jgi:hypothetical protein
MGPRVGSAVVPELLEAGHEVDLLGWQPTYLGLIDDLDKGHYFDNPST